MSDRFPDATLALSLLPAPAVIKGVDYEAIRTERLNELTDRFAKRGINYDVAGLETDPGVILQEEGAYRETLNLSAINDAARAVMFLYARGTDQDALYALLGIRRRVIQPAYPNANPPTEAVMESDDEFLGRAQIAMEGAAPGLTGGGYASIALRAAPAVRRVFLARRPGGVVQVVLQGRSNGLGETTIELIPGGYIATWVADQVTPYNDGSVPPAAVRAVTAALNDDWSDDAGTGSQLTDVPMVQSAVPRSYDIVARATLPAGPSVLAAVTLALANLVAAAFALPQAGGTVPTDALIAAGRLPVMTKFYLDGPGDDLVCLSSEVPFARSVTLTVTTNG